MQGKTLPRYDSSLKCYSCRLRDGTEILIDKEDVWLLSLANWKMDAAKQVNAHCAIHRLVMRAPRFGQIDHIFGDKRDNRKYQLRFCTTTQNCQSKKKDGGENTSRFKGVSYSKSRGDSIRNRRRKCWTATIRHDRKLEYLGRFEDEASAATAYDDAAKKYFGEFAKTNSAMGLYDESVKPTPEPVSEECLYKISDGEILIDPEDRWIADASSWRPHHKKKYIIGRVQLHRLIMRAKVGEFVDHVENNQHDFRREKLAITKKRQHGKKLGKFKRENSSSRFKGVSFDIRLERLGRPSCWSAQIRVGSRYIKIGRFRTEGEAAKAYDVECLKHFGEFSLTNNSLGLFD